MKPPLLVYTIHTQIRKKKFKDVGQFAIGTSYYFQELPISWDKQVDHITKLEGRSYSNRIELTLLSEVTQNSGGI